jgi:NAD(P)-dependent dehydrogenase (short-subunit alcohol dehydrogenase family)
VVLHYRNGKGAAEKLASELGRDSVALGADLTKEAQVRRLFAAVLKRYGRVDTLIANAGSWEAKDIPLHLMSLQQWNNTVDQVLTSAFLSLREFLGLVAKQKRGNAVLIASRRACLAKPGTRIMPRRNQPWLSD